VRYAAVRSVYLALDLILFVPLLLATLLSRLCLRPVDVGIGPLPTVASRYHKQALVLFGYRCETFVYNTWYLTADFDVVFSKYCPRALGPYLSYLYCLVRYKCIYVYFNGGPLGATTLLSLCEPFLLQLAGIKTVAMPFGADVHVLTRCKSKLVVDAYSKDYPGFRHERARTARLIGAWTRGADHIIAGCDWVDYLYYWDTLMLSQFAIDTEELTPDRIDLSGDKLPTPLRLIHAPNHRALKGTEHILRAVDELQNEGVAIEIAILEGMSNSELPAAIRAADVVVDQIIIGWYAMFAMEAMALGKPVVCHIRGDYRDLYVASGLIESDELPLINADHATIKATLKQLSEAPREELALIGARSRAFVEKHHSLQSVGCVLDRINRSIGIEPSQTPLRKCGGASSPDASVP